MQSKHVSKLATLTPFQMGVGDNTAAVVLLRHIAATNKSFFRQHGLRAQKSGTNFRPTQTESRFLRVSLRSRKTSQEFGPAIHATIMKMSMQQSQLESLKREILNQILFQRRLGILSSVLRWLYTITDCISAK
jgi:hypothetical protein